MQVRFQQTANYCKLLRKQYHRVLEQRKVVLQRVETIRSNTVEYLSTWDEVLEMEEKLRYIKERMIQEGCDNMEVVKTCALCDDEW